MNYIFSLAFRNIGRNRRRTFLAILSVTLSITFILFMKAFVTGFIDSIVRNYTRQECGHIRITTKKFMDRADFLPVSTSIANPDSIEQLLRTTPQIGEHLSLVTDRFVFGVLLSNHGATKPAMAIAGDPKNEKELSMLYKSIIAGGRYCDGSREMIMGYRLAKSLNYTTGDTVRVMTQGADFALHMRKFVITGLFRTNINAFDERIFQIGIDDARILLRSGNETQQMIIFLDNYKSADLVAGRIRNVLADTTLAVSSWTTYGTYASIVRMSGRIYDFLYLFIALLGTFIISNIMMMVVLERKKEIGILKSMGMKRRQVMILFLTEGVIMGILGSFAGIIIGTLLNALLSKTGIDFTAMMSTVTMPMDNIIYPKQDLLSTFEMFMIGALVSGIVSVLPSRQAAQLNVVDAIKSV